MTLPGFDLISATGGWAFPIFAVLVCYFCYRLGRRVQKAKTEQAKDQELFAAYQEVIPLVTCGTLRLISPEEYQNAYSKDKPLLVIDIKQKDDVRLVRQTVDQFFSGVFTTWSEVRGGILTALSEAVTNVVKHTPGGRLLVYLDPAGPRFHVEDYGSGMDLAKLPAMFVSGYSEKSTLGAGFTIMMRYVEQIEICTSEAGVSLVLRTNVGQMLSRKRTRREGGDFHALSCRAAAEAGNGCGQNHLWQ
jgi:anti-sigma regulatory factor (Ser/Thr protein kinase)